MRKSKKLSRYSGYSRMNFHGADRMALRACKSLEDFDILPVYEHMRGPLWRGPNGWGDDTSLSAGGVSRKYIERVIESNIGKSYSNFYSKMCKIFKGNDRVNFDLIVDWNFKPYGFGGTPLYSDYSILDGMIVKNER